MARYIINNLDDQNFQLTLHSYEHLFYDKQLNFNKTFPDFLNTECGLRTGAVQGVKGNYMRVFKVRDSPKCTIT